MANGFGLPSHSESPRHTIMRAFITGIGGFVGPHLAAHLVQCGDDVQGASLSGRRDERVQATGLQVLPADLQVIAWDIARPPTAQVEAALRAFSPHVIYHLAAVSVPSDCGAVEPTDQARAVNVAGVTSVVTMAASLPSRPRVVFVSTSHVYAAVAERAPLVDEQSPLAPPNGYGRSKLDGEREVQRLIRRLDADAVIVRAFKHSGPGQSPRFMLPEWARQFADPQLSPIQVHTLDSFLDISDVRDVVRAYRLVAERGATGEVYNVGSGVSRRSGDLFAALRDLADPRRAFVETRPGRRQEVIADCQRLHALTGWTPRIPIEQTIRDVWDEWKPGTR